MTCLTSCWTGAKFTWVIFTTDTSHLILTIFTLWFTQDYHHILHLTTLAIHKHHHTLHLSPFNMLNRQHTQQLTTIMITKYSSPYKYNISPSFNNVNNHHHHNYSTQPYLTPAPPGTLWALPALSMICKEIVTALVYIKLPWFINCLCLLTALVY